MQKWLLDTSKPVFKHNYDDLLQAGFVWCLWWSSRDAATGTQMCNAQRQSSNQKLKHLWTDNSSCHCKEDEALMDRRKHGNDSWVFQVGFCVCCRNTVGIRRDNHRCRPTNSLWHGQDSNPRSNRFLQMCAFVRVLLPNSNGICVSFLLFVFFSSLVNKLLAIRNHNYLHRFLEYASGFVFMLHNLYTPQDYGHRIVIHNHLDDMKKWYLWWMLSFWLCFWCTNFILRQSIQNVGLFRTRSVVGKPGTGKSREHRYLVPWIQPRTGRRAAKFLNTDTPVIKVRPPTKLIPLSMFPFATLTGFWKDISSLRCRWKPCSPVRVLWLKERGRHWDLWSNNQWKLVDI